MPSNPSALGTHLGTPNQPQLAEEPAEWPTPQDGRADHKPSVYGRVVSWRSVSRRLLPNLG
jgi:hypothetical protein